MMKDELSIFLANWFCLSDHSPTVWLANPQANFWSQLYDKPKVNYEVNYG
jgi:hypothetical protein